MSILQPVLRPVLQPLSLSLTRAGVPMAAWKRALPSLRSFVTANYDGTYTPTVMSSPPQISSAVQPSSTIASAVRVPVVGSALFKYTGPPTTIWNSDNQFIVVGSGTGASQTTDLTSAVTWEFESDASQIEFVFRQYSCNFDIWVDGELVQAAGFKYGNAGTKIMQKLDWSADAQPTRTRLYRLSGSILPFGGLYTNAGATVSYPSSLDTRKLITFFGDSFTAGQDANGFSQNYSATVAGCLGFDYWQDGAGGKGWNSASPYDPITRINQRESVMERKPDIIVTAYGFNDIGGNTDDMTTNSRLGLSRLRGLFPAAIIYVAGPWDQAAPSAVASNYTAAKNAFIAGAAGIEGATWLDMQGVAYTKTGTDLPHPDQAGYDTLGQSIAAQIKAAMGA